MVSLLIGLGNIGRRYQGTRHNAGMEALDEVAETLKATSQIPAYLFNWSAAKVQEKTITLAWPRTYMNRSGAAVEALLEKTRLVALEDMLLIVDDVNLPLGKLRFRQSGGDGGHNGLASIIETLGTEEFPRLRLGIGQVPEQMDAVEYVLGRFEPEELEPVKKMLETACEAVLFSLQHRLHEAMNKYNVNPA